jgi:hypothetical protein
MRSMRLTLSISGVKGPKVAINPMHVIAVSGFSQYTAIYTSGEGGYGQYRVTEAPDAVFHELDAPHWSRGPGGLPL